MGVLVKLHVLKSRDILGVVHARIGLMDEDGKFVLTKDTGTLREIAQVAKTIVQNTGAELTFEVPFEEYADPKSRLTTQLIRLDAQEQEQFSEAYS